MRWAPALCLGLWGCAHATTTAATDEQVKGPPAASPRRPAPAAAPSPPAAAAHDEMSTSKTTKAMFKPEGLKALQRALREKGHALDETGVLDLKTQAALRGFQKAQTLPDTGLPDYEVLRRLGLEPRDVFEPTTSAERLGVQ